MNFKYIVFVFLLTLSEFAFTFDEVRPVDIKAGEINYPLIHIFRDKNGNIIGRMYYSVDNSPFFSVAVIYDDNKNILYSVYKNKFIKKSGEVDIEIKSRPVIGYIVGSVSDYAISLKPVFGKNKDFDFVGEEISIKWNEKEKVFEVLKF